MSKIEFRIGDLVKNNEKYGLHDCLGIVTRIKTLKANDRHAKDCQAVFIHWANGTRRWKTSLILRKVA